MSTSRVMVHGLGGVGERAHKGRPVARCTTGDAQQGAAGVRHR